MLEGPIHEGRSRKTVTKCKVHESEPEKIPGLAQQKRPVPMPGPTLLEKMWKGQTSG